LELY